MSRNEKIVVSSQNTYSARELSVVTRPSIAPAKATNTPAKRPSAVALGEKYAAQ